MSVDIQFRVSFQERRDGPIRGGDTVMCEYPFPKGTAVPLRDLQLWSLKLAHEMAQGVNSELAYADFRVTDNEASVRAFGVMPAHTDCADCIRGVENAVRWLQDHPGEQLLVGQLHWAAT